MKHVCCLALTTDRRSKYRSIVNAVVVIVFLLLGGIQGCGGGGRGNGNSNPTPLIAPSGLSYSQPAIAATMNHAVTADVPTVTGTVDSYTVAPALPAGLFLNSSTGTISGTPTAISAKTSYTVTAANASGSTTTTIQITVSLPLSPTDLSYDQPAIDAATGQAITPDVPSVTGTVDSYTVAPALPAGLSLSGSTGIISGTPTALTPLTSYTVTASNASGSVSAAILISVTVPLPAPTVIGYPQTVISTYVDQEITPDIPGTAGTITRYSVSPALPAGLSMDLSTGVISGTPTAEAAQATYVVTGYNSGGSITAAVSPKITVTTTPNILLQLGNPYLINTLEFANSRVFSQDYSGFWILRDYTSGAILASGDAGLGGSSVAGFSIPGPVTDMYAIRSPQALALSGGTIAIGIPGGVQVRSSSDGHVLSTIVSPGFQSDQNGVLSESDSWQLASDGSYISVEGQSGLYVYTPDGKIVFSKSGDYKHSLNSNLSPSFFAAPGQVQVADGPAGDSNIAFISVPSGISTLSAPYDGQSQFFEGWFADGAGFFAATDVVPYAVMTYSSSGVPLGTVPGGGGKIGGMGKWVWTFGANQLSIYPAGSATPAMTVSGVDRYFIAGTILATSASSSQISIIDLSSATLTRTNYTIPPLVNKAGSPVLGSFAAASNAEWVVEFAFQGVILDGTSLSSGSSPRTFGNGLALSITGGAGRAAVATGSGQIYYFDPSDTTPEGSISLTSEALELSTDGSLLAASSQDGTLLNIYSIPSGTVSYAFSYPATGLLSGFTLSGSGTTLGQIQGSTLEVTPISGTPVILSLTPSPSTTVLLSPDGTLAAVNRSTGGLYPALTVAVYLNGQQISTISGAAVGWIDNSRLLVNSYGLVPPVVMRLSYTGCAIYSPTGTVLGAPPLPELGSIQPVTSDTVYAPGQNAIYSLTTGQTTWTNPYLAGTGGAIASPYVVFESEGRVIAVKY